MRAAFCAGDLGESPVRAILPHANVRKSWLGIPSQGPRISAEQKICDTSNISQDFQVDDTFTFWMDISRIHQAGGGCPYPAAAHPRTILKY